MSRPILALLQVAAIGATSLAQETPQGASAEWSRDFRLQDEMQIYDFPEELLNYPIEFPASKVRRSGLTLLALHDEQPKPIVFQLSDVTQRDGFLEKATLSFRSDLPKAAARHFRLTFDPGRKPAATGASRVGIVAEQNGTAVLASNRLRVRVPHGSFNYELEPQPFAQTAAPILAVARGGKPDAWCLTGSLRAKPEFRVIALKAEPVEQGPLFCRYRIAYTLNRGQQYTVVLTLRHNESYVTIDETLGGIIPQDEAYLRLDFTDEFDADIREVMSNGGYGAQGYDGAFDKNVDDDGKLPFELGLNRPNSMGVMRSAAFLQDKGEHSLLVSLYRLRNWKTVYRHVWYSNSGPGNLNFYARGREKFLLTRLEGAERHWALALIPRAEHQHVSRGVVSRSRLLLTGLACGLLTIPVAMMRAEDDRPPTTEVQPETTTARSETLDKAAPTRTIVANEKQPLIASEFVEQEIRKRINKPTGELTRADLERVRVFDFRSPLLTDEGLKDVARLSQLSRLYLNETRITDEGLKELPRLELLTCLDLSSTNITNAGLREVARLKQLTELNLYNTQITDEGLKEVARLQQLTYLNLLGTRISDEGLKEVARLRKLDTLWLVGTRITDAGLKEVARLKQLTRLSLDSTRITDVGLKEVARLKRLSYLNLSATRITDAGLKEVARLQQLSHLNLSLCEQITDAGLKELAELTQLTVLRFYGCTQITDAGLKEVASFNKLSYLDLQGTQITDAGLKELAELTQLSRLDLHGAKVSKSGVAELKKALPKCEINHNARDADKSTEVPLQNPG